jgi:hypothetical protein
MCWGRGWYGALPSLGTPPTVPDPACAPTPQYLGNGTAFILFGMGIVSFLVGCMAVALLWEQNIAPARRDRLEIVEKLETFSFASTQASFPQDKAQVVRMITTMWKYKAGGVDASEDDCIEAFEKEVREEVATELNKLLRGTERCAAPREARGAMASPTRSTRRSTPPLADPPTRRRSPRPFLCRDLFRQYLLQNVMPHLCGCFYLLFSMDWFRPVASPRSGLWVSHNSFTSFVIGVACCAFTSVVCFLISRCVHRWWEE